MRFSSKENDEGTITEPKIHASVFAHIMHGAHAYAPIGLPEHYAVVTDKGEILDSSKNPYETAAQAKSRAEVQGFSVDKMTWPMYVGLPLRRTMVQPWFKPIARIGSTGNDEYPLDSVRRVGRDVLKKELVAELTGPHDRRVLSLCERCSDRSAGHRRLFLCREMESQPEYWDGEDQDRNCHEHCQSIGLLAGLICPLRPVG